MRTYRVVPWLVCSAAALAVAVPATAQEVTYTSRTKMDMGGAMNAIVGLAARMGGGSTETIERQYIKGRRMRTDAGESSSTIMDMEGRRWLTLDHEARTYVEISMDSLMAMAQGMAQQMGQGGAPASGGAEPTEAAGQDVDYSFDVSVDRTGREEEIAGYDAEQVLVTIELEARGVPEGEREEQGGRMVLLNDLWVSTEVPGYEAMRQIQTEQGMEMASSSGMTGLAGAFGGQDARQRAAMERAAEEMAKVEGMPVRTTMHMVMVPLDQPFDRDAVLAGEQPREESGGGGVGGLVGGLLGRRRPQPQPQEQPAPTQAKLLTVVDELVEVSTGPIPDSMFEVPEGYRRVSFGAGG